MPDDPNKTQRLLEVLRKGTTPEPEQFKELILALDNHRVLAKVFLLEGTPFVFEKSPMKYIVFREQVADRFGVGSQDVAIVGSARLGFSPSPHKDQKTENVKFGRRFSETSDVDVVIISEPLFHSGTQELLEELSRLPPPLYEVRPLADAGKKIEVDARALKKLKEATRNYVFQNFNPGLLSAPHKLRREIFDKISSTSGLFLSLEPQVFVSKIRCRIFCTWKAAEDYYANSLREVQNALAGRQIAAEIPSDEDDDEAAETVEPTPLHDEKKTPPRVPPTTKA